MIFFFCWLVGWFFVLIFFLFHPFILIFFSLTSLQQNVTLLPRIVQSCLGLGFGWFWIFFFFLSSPFWWFFFFWQGGGLVFCFCFLLGWEKVCRSLLSLRCGGLEQVILMTSFLQNYSFSKQNVNPMGGKRQSNILSFDSYIIVFFITYRVLYSPSTFECYFSTSHSSS